MAKCKPAERVTLRLGDSLEILAGLEANTIDACVCDPPYGLNSADPSLVAECLSAWLAGRAYKPPVSAGFMSKAWDAWVPGPELWREVLRVLKPGGHLVAFAGSRTAAMMATAITLAGFEVRDTVQWAYWSGFPKSKRVNENQAFCQCAATGRSDAGTGPAPGAPDRSDTAETSSGGAPRRRGAPHSTSKAEGSPVGCLTDRGSCGEQPRPDAPAGQGSPASPGGAQAHSRSAAPLGGPDGGRGCTPCPAPHTDHPSSRDCRSRAATQTDSGESRTSCSQGELDRCTVDSSQQTVWYQDRICQACGKPNLDGFGTALKPSVEPAILARKPMGQTVAQNVLQWGTGGLNIDGCRYAYGDDAWPGPSSNEHLRGETLRTTRPQSTRTVGLPATEMPFFNDLGRWPANIYYCPKPSTSEREAGCDGLPTAIINTDTPPGSKGSESPRAGAGRTSDGRRNSHPTVKPIRLMRWLCRLVTPPGGVVLDPFMGSGTTGVAAVAEDLRFFGCEMEPDYYRIARARIEHQACEKVSEVDDVPDRPVKKQGSLF